MARSDGPESEIWGTWEELLLACAVNRHGIQSWDSVAMEVQSRSPFSKLLTPHGCEQRYYDLHRRFTARNMDIDGGDVNDGQESNLIPWLDELREIRVAELRREVQRSDVSIVSLQLKVKKLKEDHDRSLQEKEDGEGKPDLEETKEDQRDVKSSGSPSENHADRISSQDAGRSSNESNWTDPKDRQEPGSEDRKPEEPDGAGAGKPDPVADGQEKVAEEGSYNGSSDTIAKAATPAEEAAAAAAQAQQPEAGVSGESVAESKGEAVKENSDVQSSVSLSKRRRGRRKPASLGSSGGDEPEADEVSPVSKSNVVISQPLIAILEIIRSHKYGSIFERRLESQESAGYRSLIRQHMDLEMVRNKLEEGAYTSVELFRDLLLLCTNAIVFFPKNSPESTAAVHLREIVSKEISATVQKSDTSTQADGRVTTQQQPPLPRPAPKPDPDLARSLPEKPASVPPLIACRKRSSISAKAAAAAAVMVTMEEKEEEEREEEADPEKKEAEVVEKKRTKERSSLVGARGLRTSKTRANSSAGVIKSSNPNPNPNPNPAPQAATPRENSADTTSKADRKNSSSSNTRATSPISIAKKRSAANFLNRMKRSSPSSNGTLLETLKSSGAGGGGGSSSGRGGGGEQKKALKGDVRKDQGSRQGPAGGAASAGKKVFGGQNLPVKRSVGRPPKRPAPPLSSPPAKRAREADSSPLPPQRAGTRKRGRR